ncbi:MAG: hypothetical protein CVU57_07815 [Deltaproteobacteria bacterium HGW-Deltaproteobacteria-15]|nr:MAG: hypothetical protein CVU57_07815 [Deltaproteobacteria bacterium HGW-Deltaproteobacteria-15]
MTTKGRGSGTRSSAPSGAAMFLPHSIPPVSQYRLKNCRGQPILQPFIGNEIEMRIFTELNLDMKYCHSFLKILFHTHTGA